MKTLNGKLFKEMAIAGSNVLHNNHPEIDALNVFPVPDGDTGTNMSLTFTSGANEVEKLDTDDIFEVSKVLSRGLLMGARGNSGVILSQIFRGISKSFKGKTEVNAVELAEALDSGAKVAYKAVMRPVEGTILTVIREGAEEAVKYAKDDMDIEELFSHFVKACETSLDHTPDLLPVLKEVGVVDSGGAGLLLILTGFMAGLAGDKITRVDVVSDGTTVLDQKKEDKPAVEGYAVDIALRIAEAKQKAYKQDSLKAELERNSGVVTITTKEGLEILHLITKRPGDALNSAQRYGEFVEVKVVNNESNEHVLEESNEPVEEKEIAIISVAAGEGVKNAFLELNVDHVVSGGQTMNPSAEDIVSAIKSLHAKHVIILPNNSNIVMTAQQAAIILEDDIDVQVIPSKTIPQGLSACIMYDPEASIEDNINEMKDSIEGVKTGQVTFAIKDTNIDGIEIKANNYMALCNKEITACVPNKKDALIKTLEGLIDDDSEIVTLIYGEDVNEEEANDAKSYIEDNFEVELEVINGQQPVYSYIVGVE